MSRLQLRIRHTALERAVQLESKSLRAPTAAHAVGLEHRGHLLAAVQKRQIQRRVAAAASVSGIKRGETCGQIRSTHVYDTSLTLAPFSTSITAFS
jgi:hypothetical protein